jgi:ech hydrogenase subunit F
MPFLSMSKLVTRSAVRRPATRLYPAQRREPFPGTRGHIAFAINSCIFCNLCAKKCPTEAIVCSKADKTWQIDHTKCILCGNCVDACRKSCLSQLNTPAPPMRSHHVEIFRGDVQTPTELEAEAKAKGQTPASNDECCQNELS